MSEKAVDLKNPILTVRGRRVMIDVDLARIYGVTNKRLSEQLRRNLARFPEDFMFQLSESEKHEVAAICGHLENIKYSRVLPRAFTEHGALMLCTVLSSEAAIGASIEVVRAFVRLREFLSANKNFDLQFQKIEQRLTDQDQKFKVVFEAIRNDPRADSTKKSNRN